MASEFQFNAKDKVIRGGRPTGDPIQDVRRCAGAPAMCQPCKIVAGAAYLVTRRGGRGKRWHVMLDGKLVERFSTLEEAVAAVDYEVARRGPAAGASARHDAPWRRGKPPVPLPAEPPRG